MEPRDWLLAYIAAAEPPIDPVRLQKGLFLLARRGAIPEPERYAFEPYAYGPMSRRLYGDLRALERAGLIEPVPVEGATWQAVRITPAGASAVAGGCPEARDAAEPLRAELDGLGFAALLEAVYAEHPAYAVNSVFRRR